MENTAASIKILLVDDHPLIVKGLKSLILSSIENSVVTTATSKDELFTKLDENQPDILLLDLFIGQEKAHDFFDNIKKDAAKTKIIILSSNEDSSTISHFMNREASGFVGKSEDTSLIPLAIKTVIEGEIFLSDYLRTKLDNKETSNDQIDNIRLTRREKEVLKELLKEKSNKEIGESLFISEKTVEHHKANLYVKFNVKNASGLVKKAIINGYYE